MPRNKSYILTVVLLINFIVVCSQNSVENTSAEYFVDIPLDRFELEVDDYSIADYKSAYSLVLNLSKDSTNIKNREKGVNLLAVLAKSFATKVKNKKINLSDKKTQDLLLKFEKEHYFIEKPKVTRFIKTMDYFCKGEYQYVHQKLMLIFMYKIFLVLLSLVLLLFLASYSPKFKWKYKKNYKRMVIISILSLVFLAFIFKLTCQNNITDYSFYGLPL